MSYWDFHTLLCLEFTENGSIDKELWEKSFVNDSGQSRMARPVKGNRKAASAIITAQYNSVLQKGVSVHDAATLAVVIEGLWPLSVYERRKI